MSDETDFAALMDRLRQGDQTVAWTIFERFAQRLVGLGAVAAGQPIAREGGPRGRGAVRSEQLLSTPRRWAV